MIQLDNKPRQLHNESEKLTDLKKKKRGKCCVEGLFSAWAMVLFTKISYQHPSECKEISANMKP